jgi:hypothetical protein
MRPRRRRVTSEEANVAAGTAQAHQRFADAGPRDMPFTIDEEAIPADPLASRPRLDPAEVHPPHGELAEYVHQRARMIISEVSDDRRPVGRRRRWQRARRSEFDKPRDRARPVVHARRQHRQLVVPGCEAPG